MIFSTVFSTTALETCFYILGNNNRHFPPEIFFYSCWTYLFFYEVTHVDSSPVIRKPVLVPLSAAAILHPVWSCSRYNEHCCSTIHDLVPCLICTSQYPVTMLIWAAKLELLVLLVQPAQTQTWGRVNRWKLSLSVFKHEYQAAECINMASVPTFLSWPGRGAPFWSGSLLKARPVQVIATRSDKQLHSA